MTLQEYKKPQEEETVRILRVPFDWIKEPIRTGFLPSLPHRIWIRFRKFDHIHDFDRKDQYEKIWHLVWSHQGTKEYTNYHNRHHERADREARHECEKDLGELTDYDLQWLHYWSHTAADRLRVRDGQLVMVRRK